jgi:hypothetical protein
MTHRTQVQSSRLHGRCQLIGTVLIIAVVCVTSLGVWAPALGEDVIPSATSEAQPDTKPVEITPEATAKAKALFADLFGKEVMRVGTTSSVDDDVELAGQLLTAAQSSSDSPAMLKLLCDYAFAYGSRGLKGYPIAVEAMQLLSKTLPGEAEAASKKIALLYQRGYERNTGDKKIEAGNSYLNYLLESADKEIAQKRYDVGIAYLRKAKPVTVMIKSPLRDSVEAKLLWYGPLALAAQRVTLVERKLESNPWDKMAHVQLMQLHLVDMDDPATAQKHVKIGGTVEYKKLIPLAAGSIEGLTEDQLFELGKWYERFGQKGAPVVRHAMLTRSKSYFDRFIAIHTEADVKRTAVVLSGKRVDDALGKIAAPGGATDGASGTVKVARGKTINLLSATDPTRDRIMGTWSKVGSAIKVEEPRSGRFERFGGGGNSMAVLRTPFEVKGEYDLQVKFTRDEGDGSVGIVLPVKGEAVNFILDYSGKGKAGLSEVKRRDATKNETSFDFSLVNRKVYRVDVSVRFHDQDGGNEEGNNDADKSDKADDKSGDTTIVVKVDGKKVVNWTGDRDDLSLYSGVRFGSEQAVGFTTYKAGATIGSAKLTLASGEAIAMAQKPKQADGDRDGGRDEGRGVRDDKRREMEKRIQDGIKRFFK